MPPAKVLNATSLMLTPSMLYRFQILVGKQPFLSTDATLQYNYHWPQTYEVDSEYDQARSVVDDILVPWNLRPTPDPVVSLPLFRRGTYLETWDSACFWQIPDVPTGTLEHYENLYSMICKEAGIGHDENGRRKVPLYPLRNTSKPLNGRPISDRPLRLIHV